jgi:3-deoxy-manno-octulosonate cytidylyltransferase (CMP-KDO synthetase)
MASISRGQVIAIIPARYQSSRFPGKPLALLRGQAMIRHTWERVRTCAALDQVAIATDDERILKAARDFGATVVMTDPAHPSGTDRVWEAAQRLGDHPYVLNVQGDEPFIDPGLLAACADALCREVGDIVTAAAPLTRQGALFDANVVKTVPGPGRAWYFSRAPIPALRNLSSFKRLLARGEVLWWHHIGIYGFRREALRAFVEHGPTPLEQVECLEQLRALEMGLHIHVIPWDGVPQGIDTPEDLAALE